MGRWSLSCHHFGGWVELCLTYNLCDNRYNIEDNFGVFVLLDLMLEYSFKGYVMKYSGSYSLVGCKMSLVKIIVMDVHMIHKLTYFPF